jgi:N-acetylglutamate synthase-like GNAT family acetyltransferase
VNTPTLSPREKEFFLDEFHDTSFLIALHAADAATDTDWQELIEVCSALLTNETRVLLLIELGDTQRDRHEVEIVVDRLSKQLALNTAAPCASPVDLSQEVSEDLRLAQIWSVLRNYPLFVGLWSSQEPSSFISCVQRLAVRLKVYKLIVLDPSGGVSTGGNHLSFMNGPVLGELLRKGEAEWTGLGDRRPLLETVRAVLEGGVSSVSLCPLAGLVRELFTYEGSGTLFTLTDYCRVERLGIDDFHEVEKLLERGEREGYLKARTPAEIGQLLLHGYGARLGTVTGGLAGFCALLPYPEENAAEIVGLYTITRFQGEGIGGRLIATVIAEGEQRGFSYLFASTTQEGSQRLFERHDFRRVTSEDVAAAKWRGYNPDRKRHVMVYRRELTAHPTRFGTLDS